MINYADYEFYEETYKGSLSSDLFNSLIPKACREIDKVVNRDIKEADLEASDGYKIKFVACQLVDFLNSYDGAISNNANISSKSMDGVSKTFSTLNKSEVNKEKLNIFGGLPHELTRFL